MAAGGDAIALSAPEKSRSPRGVSLWSILCRVASQHRAPPLPHSASGQSDLSQICRRSRSPTGNPSLARDEGPGIPRSERENVFEPFYRIGDARVPDTVLVLPLRDPHNRLTHPTRQFRTDMADDAERGIRAAISRAGLRRPPAAPRSLAATADLSTNCQKSCADATLRG
jgi:hypothetical protein